MAKKKASKSGKSAAAKKSTSAASASKKSSAGPWATPDGFLANVWPTLTSDKPAKRQLNRKALSAAFEAVGTELPAAIDMLLAPLATGAAPPLAELDLFSYAPKIAAKGNAAEAYIAAAQDYPPLWLSVFAGAIELGSTTSGDIWMYGESANLPASFYLYNHETEELGMPQADALETLIFRAALFGAHAKGAVSDRELAAAKKKLSGRVAKDYFDDVLADIKPYVSDATDTWWIWKRSVWLITLLREADVSDNQIRRAFDAEAVPAFTVEEVEHRADMIPRFSPTAFYFGLASFFAGDDEALARVIALASESSVKMIRDLGVLLEELRDGRQSIGALKNVQALRTRVTALRLHEPVSTTAPLSPELAAKVEEAARNNTLDALAWEYVGTPAIAKPIAAHYRKNPALEERLNLFAKVLGKDGYRNEEAIAAFIAKSDPLLVPLIANRAIDQASGIRMVAADILAEIADPRAIAALASLSDVVDRYHAQRGYLVRLIHRAGDKSHGPILRKLLERFPIVKDEDYRTQMLANVVLALADIKDEGATAAVVSLIDTDLDAQGTDCHISIREAVLYAAGELGASEVLPKLMARAKAKPFTTSPGLFWALGTLSAKADAGTRKAVRGLVEAGRISNQTIEDSSGNVKPRSIAELFDEDLRGQDDDIAAEIAREHALVLLGDSPDKLRLLVTTVLTEWERRSEASLWNGYDAYAMLNWALIALRHHPELGLDLARPFLKSDISTARTLAYRALRTT